MNGLVVASTNEDKRLYFGFAAVALLAFVLAVAFFAFRNPILYSNTLTVQAVTDKSSCTQGEAVSISVYVINGKDESFVQPTLISYKVLNSTEQEVYSLLKAITFINPPPTFPAHSKTLFNSEVWNQKNSNYTLVESGNYTIEASLEYGTSECEIVISEQPNPTPSSASSSTPSSSPLPTTTSPLPSSSNPTPTSTSSTAPSSSPTPNSSSSPTMAPTPSPIELTMQEKIRNEVLDFIKSNHPETAQFMKEFVWTGGRVTPQNIVGAETYMYYSQGWNITVNYPVIPNPIYKVTADYSAPFIGIPYRIIWQGTWQNSTITETSYIFAQ